MNTVITLNVGGHLYTTTAQTLVRYEDSMLGALVSGKFDSTRDNDGNLFIDRDGHLFVHVLNYLRSGRLCLPTGFDEWPALECEADFYQIQPLIVEIKRQRYPVDSLEYRFIEIVEVRTGSTATIPTSNSRVKTIMTVRKDAIVHLPVLKALAESQRERLNCYSEEDSAEVELSGCNIRQRMAEFLRSSGWQLIDSTMSTSSAYDKKSVVSQLLIEQSFRDRWCIPYEKLTSTSRSTASSLAGVQVSDLRTSQSSATVGGRSELLVLPVSSSSISNGPGLSAFSHPGLN